MYYYNGTKVYEIPLEVDRTVASNIFKGKIYHLFAQ